MRLRIFRLPALPALAIALVLLGVSPRTLFARDAHAPRSHTRRPRQRHVLPESAFQVARCGQARRRAVLPKRDSTDPHRASHRTPSSLPTRAVVQMAAPDYLQLYKDPQRQTSPPA